MISTHDRFKPSYLRRRSRKIAERHSQWYHHEGTPAEKWVSDLASKYEGYYFRDMTLKDKRIRKRLGGQEWELIRPGARGRETDREYEYRESDLTAAEITINVWVFNWRRLRRCHGRCKPDDCIIEVRSGLKDDELKVVLLHEMIHAYQAMLSPAYHEWLVLDIHSRLRRHIGERRLRRYIDFNTHTDNAVPFHGVLFALKSLDLDWRLRWKYGTVFNYGRKELFR